MALVIAKLQFPIKVLLIQDYVYTKYPNCNFVLISYVDVFNVTFVSNESVDVAGRIIYLQGTYAMWPQKDFCFGFVVPLA